MFSITFVVVVAVGSIILGIAIGSAINHSLSAEAKRSRSLKGELKNTEEKLAEYQQQVTEHFAETAKLVNNLTQSYRDVHEHLSNNALKLANVDIGRQLIGKGSGEDNFLEEIEIDGENPQPPRDWAPKTSATSDTLSEGYRLDEDYMETAENRKES